MAPPVERPVRPRQQPRLYQRCQLHHCRPSAPLARRWQVGQPARERRNHKLTIGTETKNAGLAWREAPEPNWVHRDDEHRWRRTRPPTVCERDRSELQAP